MTTGTTPIQLSPDQNFEHMIGQGHIVGNLVFLSGQASISPEREIVGIDDIDAQIQQAMSNVERALKAIGPVVDWQGRVHGVEGLRVADTSILPSVPSRGTFNTAVFIGEFIAHQMMQAGAE